MPSASRDLLDINVWVALVDGEHANHQRAARYWRDEAAAEIAFCGVSL